MQRKLTGEAQPQSSSSYLELICGWCELGAGDIARSRVEEEFKKCSRDWTPEEERVKKKKERKKKKTRPAVGAGRRQATALLIRKRT